MGYIVYGEDHLELQTDFGFSCDWPLWPLVSALNYCGLRTALSCQGHNTTKRDGYIVFHNMDHATWLMEKLHTQDKDTYGVMSKLRWEMVWSFPYTTQFKTGILLRFRSDSIEEITDGIIRTLVTCGVLCKTMFNVDTKTINTDL